MGERKGTNKYYPPDYDPKKGGLNKFMGTHALRERARKLHLGILIIRFELPYNIWCEGCGNHIGMGVRYNAEKTKVGMYYSTPVYQFRMKCHLCDSHFEMKTDPGNLDYVLVSGARRQENRWDPTENGQVVPDDKRVIRQLADDAMFKLQHGVEDQSKLQSVTPTLGKLEDLQERWKDDYSANKALRNIFRTKKREIKAEEDLDKEFLKKRSLDIPLLKESEDDAKIASLIRLQPSQSIEERQKEKRLEIDRKSNFPFPLPPPSSIETNKPQSLSHSLQTEISQGLPVLVNRTTSLEKQRSSLGITFRRKESNNLRTTQGSTSTSATTAFTTHSVASDSRNCTAHDMDVDSNDFTEPLERLDPKENRCNESGTERNGESQQQWSINNLLQGENTSGSAGGNIQEPTTGIQPKAIISSTLELQSGKAYETDKRENCEIRDSSSLSSALELPSFPPSTSNSSIPSGLSLISCDYGSSSNSSGNEDE